MLSRTIALCSVLLAGVVAGWFLHKQSEAISRFIGRDPAKRFLSITAVKPRNTIFEAFSPPADVVMIGDSQTQLAEWRDIFPDVRIANRGIGGERTDDILRRMDAILAVNPKQAFLSVGFNDFVVKQTIEGALQNYRKIVDILRGQRIEVYVVSTVECSRQVCLGVLDQIREFNVRLKRYADANGLVYIDLNHGITSRQDGLLAEYTYDGIHLLGSGYAKWRDKIAPYLSLPTAHPLPPNPIPTEP